MIEKSKDKKELSVILAIGAVATAILLTLSWPFLYRVVIEPIFLHRSQAIQLYPGPLAIQAPVPALRVSDWQGAQKELSRVSAGNPSVVFFFASWCESCAASLRDLKEIQQEQQSESWRMLAVHISSTEHADRARELIELVDFPKKDAYFENDPAAEKRYMGSDRAIPLTIFVNAKGRVTGILKGSVTRKTLEQGMKAANGESL
ncbi:MAG: TlpA disulfide reductase family protein [Patescibacteria group bacterium]